jgi:NAD+ diphosphatase
MAREHLRSTTVTAPITFSTGFHDRAAHRRRDAAWLEQAWHDARCQVLVTSPSGIRTRDGAPAWLSASAAPSGERYFLGLDEQDGPRFVVRIDGEDDGSSTAGLRELAATADPETTSWLCHAVALSQWHATHQHCPRCGHATQVAVAGAERRCPDDGSVHFPRVDPAVIVLVTDAAGRALLGRHESWPAGRFSTLAGFVEPGETAEEAVRREVYEEASIRVHDVRLLVTQPWPFPASLMIGAAATARDAADPVADGDELSEVRWFTHDELTEEVAAGRVRVPGFISISRWLIDRWYGSEVPDEGIGWG